MYFLNLKALIVHLKTGPIRPREYFQYIVGFAVLNTIAGIAGALPNPASSEIAAPNLTMSILGRVIGLILFLGVFRLLYQSNGGDRGEDFLERLLALAWVLSLRIILVLVPVFTALYALSTYRPEFESTVILISVPLSITSLIYPVVVINGALKEISSTAAVVQSGDAEMRA